MSPVKSEPVEPQCSVTHTTSQACCTSVSQNKTTLLSGSYWQEVTASIASLGTVGGGCHDDRMPVSHVKEAVCRKKQTFGGGGVGKVATASKRSDPDVHLYFFTLALGAQKVVAGKEVCWHLFFIKNLCSLFIIYCFIQFLWSKNKIVMFCLLK